jgi:hypothetical protein
MSGRRTMKGAPRPTMPKLEPRSRRLRMNDPGAGTSLEAREMRAAAWLSRSTVGVHPDRGDVNVVVATLRGVRRSAPRAPRLAGSTFTSLPGTGVLSRALRRRCADFQGSAGAQSSKAEHGFAPEWPTMRLQLGHVGAACPGDKPAGRAAPLRCRRRKDRRSRPHRIESTVRPRLGEASRPSRSTWIETTI